MPLTNEQNTLLSLISSALFSTEVEILSKDWQSIYREAYTQAVLPLAFSVAKPYMPENQLEKWKKASNHTMASNMNISYEHTELNDLMLTNGIPYVILKGVASSSYYPNPIIRTFGDVDFFIYNKDWKKVEKALKKIGFRAKKDNGDIHIGYYRGKSTWEMHYSINGIPGGNVGNVIRDYLSDIIKTAVDYDEGNGMIRIPDTFHHGLVLLLHTASHLTSEGIGLRHLCDWAVFEASLSNEVFRELFESKLQACGLWRFAQLLTLVSIRYLHAPERIWAGEAEESLLEEIIVDILSGGNFGHKDIDRYRQIKYISNRGEYTVDDKNVIRQVWNNINKKSKIKSKSKIKVICDYFKLVLKGERKLDNIATITKAKKRKNLYQEFRLFKT